jgi:hypothetical protein
MMPSALAMASSANARAFSCMGQDLASSIWRNIGFQVGTPGRIHSFAMLVCSSVRSVLLLPPMARTSS